MLKTDTSYQKTSGNLFLFLFLFVFVSISTAFLYAMRCDVCIFSFYVCIFCKKKILI